VEQRREMLRILQNIQNVIFLAPQSQEAAEAQQWLNESILDSGEYAAMCRVFLQ